jgi:hypothetical protein
MRIPVMTTTTPPGGGRPAPESVVRLEITSGDTALSLWGGPETAKTDPVTLVQLQLGLDRPVVIGRQEGSPPPYLDPSYCPTRIVPGTGQAVVQSDSEGNDLAVSRAHFMLRGAAGGIVLTNGVPRVGGGIRPPPNGTWLCDRDGRLMDPGEEYLIDRGATAVLVLPNRTVVRIRAE